MESKISNNNNETQFGYNFEKTGTLKYINNIRLKDAKVNIIRNGKLDLHHYILILILEIQQYF